MVERLANAGAAPRISRHVFFLGFALPMSFEERLYAGSPAWLQNVLLNTHALRISRHRYGKPFRTALAHLKTRERISPDEIRAYQEAKLRHVSRFAFAQSAYYRSVMRSAGFDEDGIRTISDLRRLPLLNKETIRDRGRELLTAEPPGRGWLNGHTSGTTGSPLSIWYDRATCVLNNAVDAQQKSWAGMQLDDWIGVFLGRMVVPVNRQRAPYWRANHVQRQLWFSSFHMKDATLPEYVAEIRHRKLCFLEGYPSTMFILAQYVLATGTSLPMKAIFTSSETLHDVQRDTIQRAFAAPVFDFYGMAERVVFGAECEEHAGKHLAESYGYTEVVDDAGRRLPDGEVGYVVGTSLHNTAMPLIRYRTNDMSAIEPSECACGRTSRRLRNVTTKAEDIVILPSGRMVSPSILTHPFKPFDQIAKSQIIQETASTFTVKLVTRQDFLPEHEAALLSALHERLGDDVAIRVERVEDIPREPSGKYRWVVSRVPHSLNTLWTE